MISTNVIEVLKFFFKSKRRAENSELNITMLFTMTPLDSYQWFGNEEMFIDNINIIHQ